MGRFTEGHALIESAVEQAPTVKTKRIATTALVDCLRLWAADELRAGSAAAALRRALDGVATGLRLHLADSTDKQLVHAIVRAATTALEAASQSAPEEGAEKQLVDVVQRFTENEDLRDSQRCGLLSTRSSGFPMACGSASLPASPPT